MNYQVNKKTIAFLLFIFVFASLFLGGILDFNNENLKAEEIEVVDNDKELLQGNTDKLTIRFFNLKFSDSEKEQLRQQHDTAIKSGDAILITTKRGKNILIDAGMPQLGEQLDQLLDLSGVDKLDYAFATHPHWDHIGGFLTLFQTREIKEFYHTNVPNDTSTYYDYLSLIDSEGINANYLEKGDELEIDDLQLKILNPPKNTSPDNLPSAEEISTSRINNLSLVVRVQYKENDFLFTGDIYREAEREIIKTFEKDYLDVDLVQAPHHGEETSSSLDFIETVGPDKTIISRDELASMSIYNRYLSYNSEVYVTGLNGHVIIESDGNEIEITPEKEYEPEF